MALRLICDAILVFFGTPTAPEDDPQRAVLAALPRAQRRTDIRVLAIDGGTFDGILCERPEFSFAVLRRISSG